MSAIPVVGKIFDVINETPVLKAVVIAAVIYFTASAAVSYFSAAGATTAAAGGGMAATTGAAATEAAAAGVAGAEATVGAATATTAGTVGTAALNTSLPAVMTTAEIAAAETAATKLAAGTVAKSWFASNPVATMMLGQGVSGAASSYEARKASDKSVDLQNKQLDLQENARKDRGLMGYNYDGSPGGNAPGIVSSQMNDTAAPPPEQAPANAVAAPMVAQQQTNAPIIASQQVGQQAPQNAATTPVKVADLPKLNQPRA